MSERDPVDQVFARWAPEFDRLEARVNRETMWSVTLKSDNRLRLAIAERDAAYAACEREARAVGEL